MSKQTLNSYRYFADSLVSYLISSSPGKELSLNGEIDEISQIAFASIQMPLYCHKDTIDGNLLLEFEQPLESRTLKDGVLKPICESLTAILKDRTNGIFSYEKEDVSLLLVAIKRGLCLLKKTDGDHLDSEELALAVLSTLLIRSFEQGEDGVTFHLLSFLLDGQYSKKLMAARNSLY